MVRTEQLSMSKEIHRQTGRTFYTATKFLPRRIRHATYVLYAFFRLADEVVDDDRTDTPVEQRAELERLRAEALGKVDPTHPVLAAFRELADRHGIADETIDRFVDAMLTDTTTSRYATHEELSAYMDGSSVAVADMMMDAMDVTDPERARPHAAALAEAFQLTNIIRDVREDVVDRDRIYLPQSTLADHGVAEDDIYAFRPTSEFRATIHDELERTEQLYREGIAGIAYLPTDCQFPVLLAAILYADHHRSVRTQGYDVLTERPTIGTLRKLRLVIETRLRWAVEKDPGAVFRAVSAVPEVATGTPLPNHTNGSPI